LEMVRKEIGDYIYANLRRSDEFFSTEPLGEYLAAFEILRKTSPFYEGLSAVPRQVSRIEQEVLPLLSFSNNLRVLLSLMREALRQKDPALAYLYFLIYLYTMLNELEKAPRAGPAVTLHTTFFKDLAREAGIPLENPDVLPADERLKVLNAFTGAFLEKIENGEGVKGLHAPEQALKFLERIYAKYFWTEAERLERLNSKAALAEPAAEEISPAAAMLREASQPPAASPKTIGAVIEILRAVSGQQEPFAPASLRIMDARLEEIAKSSPGVDAVQTAAIVKGMLRPFMSRKSKPNLPAEIKNLETYPAIKMKALLTRIWAVFFTFYLEEFQDKEYRKHQEPSDRETLLQMARAIDPRLADSFQEFTVLMLQPQEGKTLADLPPASVISKILAPWRDSSSGEELQKAILYAFNYFLYPAGMLLARFPSDAVAGRFTPMLYFIRSDFDLNLIHLGAHTQWSLAGSPAHYGRLETFTTPLIPGIAISNKTLESFSQQYALWLRPEMFTGSGREAALKKSDKILGHSFSEKMRQSPLPYSLVPETIAGLDAFFAALKKKALSGASSAKSAEALVEKLKIHRVRFQTVLELYRNISREREWGRRFGEEKTKSLRLLFSVMIAGTHFPSIAFDEFHDFLVDFTANPEQKESLELLNALLPETAPLAGESDPKRRTEQLEKILSAMGLEKLTPGLFMERALVFMQKTFGEDLFK
ncbi:MAG TPA: hypothetical protein VJC08_04715, partial [bacterium]|nr:hypothetical protein [bacterium]